MSRTSACTALLVVLLALASIGCGNDSQPPTSSIQSFQPEVINNADAFQFQITDAANVSTTLDYTWSNSKTAATIDHSTVTDSGMAVVTLFDSGSSEVYSDTLVASGNVPSDSGVAGDWTVRVTLTNFYGTVNFRVESL